MKELGDNSEDTLEVVRSHSALPLLSNASGMHDNDRSVLGIHVFACGGEQEVYSPLGRQLRVIFESPWVAVEVFARPELQRIDEDAHHDDVGHALRFIDQGEMTLVKRAHRRHECDALPLCSHAGNYVAHLINRPDRLHA